MRRLLLPDLDRSSPSTLAAFYRAAITAGQLRSGDRLPPIREAADAVKVARTTVQDAYKKLADGGLVTGEVGRGTTVLQSATATAPEGGR